MKRSKSSQKQTEHDALSNEALEKLCSSVKKQDYQATFSASETWIRQVAALSDQNEQVSTPLLPGWHIPRVRLSYFAVLIVVLLAAANIPITKEETLGHVLKWTTSIPVNEATAIIQQKTWSAPYQLAYTLESNDSKTSFFLTMPQTSDEQALRRREELSDTPGFSSVSVHPLQETLKQPAYATVLRPFGVRTPTRRLSNYEMIRNLETQMHALGMDNIGVFFDRDQRGRPALHLWVASQFAADTSAFGLHLVNDSTDGQNRFPFDPKIFEGKSREEIKALMREALREQFFEKWNSSSESPPPDDD